MAERKPKLVQKKVADDFGVTQGMISQYLNGETVIGVETTLKFARLFNVSPLEIRPDFAYADLVPGKLSPDAVKVATRFDQLPEQMRPKFLDLILSTPI